MAAAETMDISDLVFVNWAKEEYELSSLSETDSITSSENAKTSSLSELEYSEPDVLAEFEIGSSYIEIKKPSNVTCKFKKDSLECDLSVFLHLFDDYQTLKDAYSSDFPHMFLDLKYAKPSTVFFITLVFLGLSSYLLLPARVPKPEIASSQYVKLQISSHVHSIDPMLQVNEIQSLPTLVCKNSEFSNKSITNEEISTLKDSENKKRYDTDLHSPRWIGTLLRLLRFFRNVLTNAQRFIKKRIFQLRRDCRLFYNRNK